MSSQGSEVVYIMKKSIGQHAEEIQAEIDRITLNIEQTTESMNQQKQTNQLDQINFPKFSLPCFNPVINSPFSSQLNTKIFKEEKTQDPLIIEKIIQVEKVVEVPVEKIVYVPIQKIVHIQKVIQIEKTIEVPVQKTQEDPIIIQVQKIIQIPVERVIQVQKIVEVEKIVVKDSQNQTFNSFSCQKVFSKYEPEIRQIQKIIEVPVERIVEIPIQKIIEVPVEKQKIIEIQIQKEVYIPVDRTIEKLIQRFIEVPVEKVVQVQIQQRIQVEIPMIIQKIIEVPLLIEKEIQMEQNPEMHVSLKQGKEFTEENQSILEKIIQVPIQIIKEVQKIIEVPVEKQIEKVFQCIIQVPVEIQKQIKVPLQKIVEKQVIVQVPIEVQKEIFIEKIIEIPVQVQKLIEVPIEMQKIVYQEPKEKSFLKKSYDFSFNNDQDFQKISDLEGQCKFNSLYSSDPEFLSNVQFLKAQIGQPLRKYEEKRKNNSRESLNNSSNQNSQEETEVFQDFLKIKQKTLPQHAEVIENLSEELMAAQSEISEYQNYQKILEQREKALEGELIQRNNQLQEKSLQLSSLNHEFQFLKQQFFENKKKSRDLEKQLKTAHQTNHELFKQNMEKSSKIISISEQYQQLIVKNIELKNQITKSQQQQSFENLRKNQQYKALESWYQMMNKSLEESNFFIEELKEKIEEAEDDKAKVLMEKKQNQEAMVQEIQILKEAMKLSKYNQNQIIAENELLSSQVDSLTKENESLKSKYSEKNLKLEQAQQKIESQKDFLSPKKQINQQDQLQLFSSISSKTNSQFDDLESSRRGKLRKKNSDKTISISERQMILKNLQSILESEIKNSTTLSQIFHQIDKLNVEVQHRERKNDCLNLTDLSTQKNSLETFSTFISFEEDIPENQYIKNLECALMKSEKLVEVQQKQKQYLLHENEDLQHSVSEMKKSLSQGFDIETENLIQQLTSQLQKQKAINMNLQKKLSEYNQEMLKYKSQIIESTEKIKQLKLFFMKKSNQKQNFAVQNEVFKGVNTQLQNLTVQLHQIKAKHRKYEIENLQLKKQKQNLQKDLQILKINQEENDKIPLHLKAIEKEELDSVFSLNKFITEEKLTEQTKYIIIVKIIEFFHSEMIERDIYSYHSLEPENIFLVGSIANHIGLVMQVNKPKKSRKHAFMAPEELNSSPGRKTVVWNLGLLIDYVIHGVSYFNSPSEIKNYRGFYKMKAPSKTWHQLKSVISEMLYRNPSTRPSFEICTEKLLERLNLIE